MPFLAVADDVLRTFKRAFGLLALLFMLFFSLVDPLLSCITHDASLLYMFAR